MHKSKSNDEIRIEDSTRVNDSLKNPLLETQSFGDNIKDNSINSSKKMNEVFESINRIREIDVNVLLRGENGTGKELIAHTIHKNSTRRHRKFVAVNCAAIPSDLIESELFGHEKGAVTDAIERKIGLFEQADKGTLFLDEIGELQMDLQDKLLCVLKSKASSPKSVGKRRFR